MVKDSSDFSTYLPYGRQYIDEEDIRAVEEVLRSDWLTTGPMVGRFEKEIADFTGAEHCIAVSSGTAALHTVMHAINIGPGDEVIVPAITFVATANSVVFQGGTPVFTDVEEDTLLLDPAKVEEKITSRTKAIVAVDYAGQPCDYDILGAICRKYNLFLVADSCHALGAQYNGRSVGSLADFTVFSFHPVKHITTGEGGAIVTDDSDMAEKMRRFRNHGIASDHRQRESEGTWYYEMLELGFNYRISDIQCALGISQLKKLPSWLDQRHKIASSYNYQLRDFEAGAPLSLRSYSKHAYHLYVLRLRGEVSRKKIFQDMRNSGIGVNVHYIPVHMHPFYQKNYDTFPGLCPVAEKVYQGLLSLPIYSGLREKDLDRIIGCLKDFFHR